MRTFDIVEAAAFLKIHPETLRKKTEIPRARFGRAFVFLEDDLAAHVRSQYASQVPCDGKDEQCSNSRSAKTRPIGGLKEQQQTASEYTNLLEPRTSKRRMSTERGLRTISGGKRG